MLMAARGASVLLTDVSSCKDQLREAVKGIKEAGGIGRIDTVASRWQSSALTLHPPCS